MEINNLTTEQLIETYSNTVKGWFNLGHGENLHLHYYTSDSNESIYIFASQLPYLLIIFSIAALFWNNIFNENDSK